MEKCHTLKRYTITFLLMVLVVFSLNAQAVFTEYSGKIIDGRSNKALEAVSLNINETNIGTITNSEGEFVIKVASDYLDSKVTISLLGYDTYSVPLSQLAKADNVIKLYVAVTELSAVSISAFKNAESLVQKVFRDKMQHLDDQSLFMTAFYRETIKLRNRNVSLTEAVVNILKQPNSSSLRDAIQLSKARKSTDYKRLDTVSVKLQGGPFSALYLDIIKYPEHIFTEESIKIYNFSFDEPSVINNRAVYVVNFIPKANVVGVNYIGKLFIDVELLALAGADYALDLSDKKRTKNLLVKKKPKGIVVYPLEASYKVAYKVNGKTWYYNYSNLNLKFKINKKKQLFNKVYTLASEMAVTDWEVNSADKRIKIKDRLKPTMVITDAISGFSDPNFWGKYNLIEPDKSIESAIAKIKKNIEKEKQDKKKKSS